MADKPFDLFYLPFRPALDANGIVVSGARLTFYLSGTTTLHSIYADAALTIELANPLTANAAGVWPSIYIDNSVTYRVVLEDAAGSLLDEADPYVPGYLGGERGGQGIPGPTDWHSQNALAALPNLSRAIRNRAFTTTPIKIAGVGSSNMLNENGGLSGAGNSPVEVALRELKAALDPFDTCIWEFENFGVNGTAYSGWGTAIDRPMSPRDYVQAYDPDLLVTCYGTNDYSPENFNVGETRTLIPFFMSDIFGWCYEHDTDVINMIPPAPHVGKSKQTRNDPVTGLPVQGRALNYTVPTSYPTRSFQRGQQNDQAPAGDLLVTFSGGNTITAPAGTFDDSSLYTGAIIWVAHPNLLSPIVNGGYYRVASVSGDKSQLVLSNVATVNAYDYVLGAAVALTNAGPIRVTIWRVALDPFTELTPSFTEAFDFIDVDGAQVEVTVREQLVSQDVRQQAAVSQYNVVLLDTMYDYLRAVVEYGEDRYYPGADNNVHWNSTCVDEVIAPAFRKLANSLIEAPSSRGAYTPVFQAKLAVRPEGVPLLPAADMGINRAVDIQMADGESAVIRTPSRALHTEFRPEGGTISHLGSTGLPFKQEPIVLVEANVSQANGVVIPLPMNTVLEGVIFGQQPGVGVQMRRLSAFNYNGTITFQVDALASTANDVFTIASQANAIKLSVAGANTQLWTNLTFCPFTYGEYQY